VAAGLAVILMTGCPRPAGESRPDGQGDESFLALGDSYTIGEGVPPYGRWPVLLAGLLREEGASITDPRIIARTGWTTDDLIAAIEGADVRGPYRLVTLLIGVNNQYQGRDVGEYREQFADLLKRAVGFAGGEPGRVIVLSIPDWGVTPFAKEQGRDPAVIAREIDGFNAVNREETEKAGARYVDVTAESRDAGGWAEMLAGDGLHPSLTMYRRWADAALPAAKEALSADAE
jgi:lysophospholipase L1-like esterase